jgi:hypothetical protein
MPRSEPARTYPAEMPPIPAVTDLDRAFPVASQLPGWPDISALPVKFQNGDAPACRLISTMFTRGPVALDGVELHTRYDAMTQEEGDAVFLLVGAHMRCYDYKHEHKIAGCGAILDQWFEVAPVKK